MFLFIQKQDPKNFVILFPRILKLFAREICKFFKK